ncbi:RteC domain-containing protein, partial [Algoriphagus sp. D3-2-R+10]|uniref:RteC domain-containing protein n=1 Tax=Algoriphagus aurantiacus TaxID=3103948 RepID=UPI002B3D569C
MEQSLKIVSRETSNGLQKAERCCQVINEILIRLKEFMTGYTFPDTEEEILFFKEYKPMLFKELIFYSELTYIEAKKPIGQKEQIKSFYPHVMDQIQEFFARNHQLYIYYQLGKSDQDETLFLRNSKPVSLIPDYSFDFDPVFSTINSSKLAKIMAYESLTDHIRKTIYRL